MIEEHGDAEDRRAMGEHDREGRDQPE